MLFNQQSSIFPLFKRVTNKLSKSNKFNQVKQFDYFVCADSQLVFLCQFMTGSNFSRSAVGHSRESRTCSTSASLHKDLEFVSGGLSKVAQLKPRSS